MKQARADAVAVARYFEYYGGAADKLHGDTIPFLDGYFVATVWEPKGVTGHIIPWNYPSQMFGRTVAASLAVGNACVMKPAEEACLAPLRLAELAAEAGFPEGALNVVPGLGEEAGAALADHPGIDFISFTGSLEVGTLVQTAAARNHIGCTLELGGKSPQIVFADADWDAALASVVAAIVQNAGQTCSAGSRLLLERKIWDRFMADLAARFAKVDGRHAGDGPRTRAGDLGEAEAAHRGHARRRRGAPARSGSPKGRIADGVPADGFFVKPAIYGARATPTSALVREEVFGPILAAMPFDDEAEAVRLANSTDYGLVAGVWSGDGARAMRVARKVRAGQVFVNGYGAGGGIELPFGGMKKSGHGREKGFVALLRHGGAEDDGVQARLGKFPSPARGKRDQRRKHASARQGRAGHRRRVGLRRRHRRALRRRGRQGRAARHQRRGRARRVAAEAGDGAIAVACDVTRGADVDPALAATLKAFGRLDIVVNNAGWTHRNKPILEVTEEEFDRIYAINVKAIYLMTQRYDADPARRRRRLGHQHRLDRRRAPASRPDLVQRLEGLRESRLEVARGRTRADEHPRQLHRAGARPDRPDRGFHGRPGDAGADGEVSRHDPARAHVASLRHRRACVYLASDEAEFITGVVLPVDGGRTI